MNGVANTHNLFLAALSILFFISIFASKLTSKLGIPTLLTFLVVGILLGVGGFELINRLTGLKDIFRREDALHLVGNYLEPIGLSLVLFLGGLETDILHIQKVWKSGAILSTVAIFCSALLVGLLCHFGFGMSFLSGCLLGTIVASTDAAAVFSVLRAYQIKLKNHLGSLLELESGTNDVFVIFLIKAIFEFKKGALGASTYSELIGYFFKEMGHFVSEMLIGTIGGVSTGYLMLFITNRINLIYGGLYPPLNLSMIFLCHQIVDHMHGSPYLAIYIAGIILGNHDFVRRKALIGFYKGINWSILIVLFATLGLLMKPGIIWELKFFGVVLSAFVLFVGRPFSVFLSLFFSEYQFKEKILLAWGGIRGALPIIFASKVYSHGNLFPEREQEYIFHLIFFLVLISMGIQGGSLPYLARKFNLVSRKKSIIKKSEELEELPVKGRKMFVEIEIPTESPVSGKPVVSLGLPHNTYIALIHRERNYLTVQGSTVIEGGDKLMLILDNKKELEATRKVLAL